MVGARISTMTNQQQLIQQMLRTQTRVFDYQTQVGTEKRSQNYRGIAPDSFRLVNLENDRGRIDRYVRNNQFAATDLEAMQTATISMADRLTVMRNALLEFTGRDLSGQGPEAQAAVDNIQAEAFSALNDMEFLLNLRVDGKFLFGGGTTDREPVSIRFDNAAQFRAAFDGVDVTYPTTRVAALNRQDFSVAAATYTNPTVGGNVVGQIVGGTADEFVTQVFDETDFGDLTFTNNTTDGTIAASTTGAFSTLEVGMSFFVNGTETGGTGSTDNNGVYTITAISADGSTLTVEPPVNTGNETAAAAAVEIKLTYPNGSTIELKDSALGNDGFYTVNWPTNADLVAAGVDPNGAGTPVADGTYLFLNSALPAAGGPEALEIEGYTYYNGDDLERRHRINESNEVVVGINGQDAAFEKAIRGLGIVLQGDLLNNPDRALDALNLINNALNHSANNTTELPSDMEGVATRIAINQSVVDREINRLKDFKSLIENRITELENVDVTEAAVRLNDEVRSLEISFATLSRIQQLSLNNYI